MAFDFPTSPSAGQEFTPTGGPTYVWESPRWLVKNNPSIISDTAPTSPQVGQLWYESDSGNTFIWYNDGNSSQWVQTNVQTAISATTYPAPKNYLINGDFSIAQRLAAPPTGSAYQVDRWYMSVGAGATQSVGRSLLGIGVLPFDDKYYYQWARTVAGSAVSFLTQKIENVQTLQGKVVTVTFWANAGTNTTLDCRVGQYFGTGGSPSATVNQTIQTVALTTAFTKYSLLFTLPSVAGKTIGTTAGTDYVYLQFLRNHNDTNPTTAVNLLHVSLCEGNQTAHPDPFEMLPVSERMSRCLRYTQYLNQSTEFFAASAGQYMDHTASFQTMRVAPTATVTTAGTTTNASSGVNDYITAQNMRLGTVAAAAGLSSIVGRWFMLDAEIP